MKIIDFERKGNVVRFYLGDNDCTEYWGDDWNDKPYDCNAGEVYNEYILGYKDVYFNFDTIVLEPCNGDEKYSKEDMKDRKVPCIIAIAPYYQKGDYREDNFSYWLGNENIEKFYFEDLMNGDKYER